MCLNAQSFQLSGTVLDAKENTPVIGANILIEDSSGKGTVTDLDGKFSLEISVGESNISK